jgi:hypothetical protein
MPKETRMPKELSSITLQTVETTLIALARADRTAPVAPVLRHIAALGPAAVTPLSAAATNADPCVRLLALVALSGISHASVAEVMQRVLNQAGRAPLEDMTETCVAVRWLARHADPKAVGALRSYLRHLQAEFEDRSTPDPHPGAFPDFALLVDSVFPLDTHHTAERSPQPKNGPAN